MLILVNENDEPIGSMEKMEAHEKALLHRAFSVFIFNSEGKLLLQQRAFDKYHTPGLWTNTCCSHPFPGEETKEAAIRRLKEEMGMQLDLEYVTKFQYKVVFDNHLTEHEIDHVFVGYTNKLPIINKEEVNDYLHIEMNDLMADINKYPQKYTPWFKIILQDNFLILKELSKKQST